MNETPVPLTVSAMMTLGRSVILRKRLERSPQRGEVVAVAARDIPAERAELGLEVAQVADARHPGVRLDLVVVDDHRDLAQSARSPPRPATPRTGPPAARRRRSARRSLPGVPCEPVGEGHALGLRDAHAERAGVGHDARRRRRRDDPAARPGGAAAWMCSKGRTPEPDQHRVEARRVVALGGEEEVRRGCRVSFRYSQVTMSSELKLVPMCPEPARAIMYRVLIRQSVANSRVRGDRAELQLVEPLEFLRRNEEELGHVRIGVGVGWALGAAGHRAAVPPRPLASRCSAYHQSRASFRSNPRSPR